MKRSQNRNTKSCGNAGNVVVLQQQPPLFIFPGREQDQWKQKHNKVPN